MPEHKVHAFFRQLFLHHPGNFRIQLPWQQVREKLQHRDGFACTHQSVCGFKPQQPAAYHNRMLPVLHRGMNGFQIIHTMKG